MDTEKDLNKCPECGERLLGVWHSVRDYFRSFIGKNGEKHVGHDLTDFCEPQEALIFDAYYCDHCGRTWNTLDDLKANRFAFVNDRTTLPFKECHYSMAICDNPKYPK